MSCDVEHDPARYADFSKELSEMRRAMRKKILDMNNPGLKDLYYRVLMLSEHEARRTAFLEAEAANGLAGIILSGLHQPPGAYLIDGRLFFRLLDGSSISCECVAGPFAEKVVELFNKASK